MSNSSEEVRPVVDLRRMAVHGFFWLMALSIVGRATGLLSQVFLAHLLDRQDFGSIALASTASNFVAAIIGFGVDDVLVQRQRALYFWGSSAFVLSIGLSLIGACLILVSAPFVEHLYHLPGLWHLLAFSALSLPLSAASILPQARMRAAMRFKALTTMSAVEVIGTAALTIALAWRGFGALSFVIPLPIAAAVRSIAYWLAAPVKLGRPSIHRIRRLLGRGTAVFLHRIVVSAIAQGDYVILGLVTNPVQVGLYYFSYKLAIQPVTILAGNITSVLFPLLTNYRKDPSFQKKIVLQAIDALNMLVIPICILQAALSYPLVPLIFGAKWTPAINILAILTVGISVEAAAWQAGALLNARGKFWSTFKYTTAIAPLFFLFIVPGAHWGGALGVAVAVSLYYIVFSASFTYLSLRKDGVSIYQVAAYYLIPASMGGAAVGIAFALSLLPIVRDLPLLRAAVILCVGVAGYLFLWHRLRPNSFATVSGWALARLRRRGQKSAFSERV